MTDKAKPSILRVKFLHSVKLGTHDLSSWHAEKTMAGPALTADATAQGMVFTGGAAEVVVPWANIVSYERGAKS